MVSLMFGYFVTSAGHEWVSLSTLAFWLSLYWFHLLVDPDCEFPLLFQLFDSGFIGWIFGTRGTAEWVFLNFRIFWGHVLTSSLPYQLPNKASRLRFSHSLTNGVDRKSFLLVLLQCESRRVPSFFNCCHVELIAVSQAKEICEFLSISHILIGDVFNIYFVY